MHQVSYRMDRVTIVADVCARYFIKVQHQISNVLAECHAAKIKIQLSLPGWRLPVAGTVLQQICSACRPKCLQHGCLLETVRPRLTALAATAQQCSYHRCSDSKPRLRDKFIVILFTPGRGGVLRLQVPSLGWAVHTQPAH